MKARKVAEKKKRRAEELKRRKASGELDDETYAMLKSDDELKAAESDDEDLAAANGEGESSNSRSTARRYVSFKLIDLRQINAGGGSGIVNVKLFESDPQKSTKKQDQLSSDEDDTFISTKGIKVKKDLDDRIRKRKTAVRTEFRGGSGGAYEKFWKERNGTVVAILNPRIMKPWVSDSRSVPDALDRLLRCARTRNLV